LSVIVIILRSCSQNVESSSKINGDLYSTLPEKQKMIAKEYDEKIKYHGWDSKKLVKRSGIISVTAILLVLVTALESQSSLDITVFAQEQNNSNNTTGRSSSNASQTLNSTQVGFVSNIEQIRGHLNAAVMNKEADNTTLSKAHTLHPIAEIYSSIEPQISSANITLNQTLASDLNQLSEMVNTSSIDEFDTQSQRINGILNQTLQQVIPANIADNNTFRLGVVSDLLSIAGVEYGEAVENGTIKEIVEYQDGQAFVSRAQDVFSEASPTLTDLNEVQETNMFFSDLTGAIQNKSSPEVVNRSIGAIIHEISEITGISEENLGSQSTGTGSAEIISEIRSLLNQTVQAYQQRNYPEAEALATTAYIDNFEFIEAPLAEKDEALMENTEVMLREQLRQLIQDQVPIEQLQQHIAKINSNLDRAEQLLGVML
jgi:hypothetical protein